MKRFYYIARIQTWVNVGDIEVVFRDGTEWTIIMRGGSRFQVNDGEYTDLLEELKKEPPRFDDRRKDDHRRKEED